MFRTIPTLVGPLFAVVAVGACADPAPSASDWAAKVNDGCAEINAARDEIAAQHLPTGGEPTRDQLMAFFADFGPDFRAYGERLAAIDRPDDLDDQIDDLFAAFDDVVDEIDQAATDPTAAQAQIDAEGNTEAGQRLVQLSTDLGLTTCVG
jgi:hypothetical protein